MNVDGGHGAFRGRDDGQLRLWSDVAGRIDSLDARLLRVIHPQ
jgi:hypothetical protein